MPSAAFSHTTTSQPSAFRACDELVGLRAYDRDHARELRLQVSCRLHGDRDAVRQRMLQLVGAEAGRRACREQQADDVQVLFDFAGRGIEARARASPPSSAPSRRGAPRSSRRGSRPRSRAGSWSRCTARPGRAGARSRRRRRRTPSAARGARRCSSSSRWRRRRTRRTSAPSISARSSSFGSCVSATSALCAVELQLAHHVVGHAAVDRHRGEVPAGGVFLARIDHHHVVVEHARHLARGSA